MARSLPDISQKVVANAQGFINEFQRADNASRRTAASIDREVEKMTKSLSRKWSLGGIGKDLMKGFGLGSGFAVAQQASEMIVAHYREAAESAKNTEESIARQLDITKKIIALRQTTAQQTSTLEADFARKGRELETARAPRFVTTQHSMAGDVVSRKFEREKTREEIAEIQKLTEEYSALGLQLEENRKKAKDKDATDRATLEKSDHDRKVKAMTEGLKQQEDAFDALIKKQSEANEKSARLRKETAELAEKYKEIADPTLRFTKQMEEANRLASEGVIKYSEAARAVEELKRQMADDKKGRINKDLEDFFEDMDRASEQNAKTAKANTAEIERIVGRGADGMADAWVDSLRGVEGAWSNLGDSIISEILRIAAQILIVKPIINSIGGMLGGTGVLGSLGSAMSSYGGGKASGGTTEPSVTYRVNEDGQEFFKSNVGGTIIPVGASRGMAGKQGDTYYIDATGADQGAIARLENMIRALHGTIEQRALAAVVGAKRRGGGMGRALA